MDSSLFRECISSWFQLCRNTILLPLICIVLSGCIGSETEPDLNIGAANAFNVAYRINAGGRSVPSTDGEAWSPGIPYVNSGIRSQSSRQIDLTHVSIPTNLPADLFASSLWDSDIAPEMQWNLPIQPGEYEVRLYFAETWEPAFSEGIRVFDVSIEGTTVLDDYDIYADVGRNRAVMHSFNVLADSTLTIDFTREAQNPIVSAIEVLGLAQANQPTIVTDLIHVEAENYNDNVSVETHTWRFGTDSEKALISFMQALPDRGELVESDRKDDAAMLSYDVDFAEPGTYYVWVRGFGDTDGTGEGKSDSVHIGLNGDISGSADKMDRFPARWGWTNHTRDEQRATIEVPTAGINTLNVWMREDGLRLDKLILTKSSTYSPSEEIHIEAESYNRISNSTSHQWQIQNDIYASGYMNMVTTPDSGRLSSNSDLSPMLGYNIHFPEPGTYYVWVRGLGDTDTTGEGKSDSVHIGLNGVISDSADKIDNFPPHWSWTQNTRDQHIATVNIDRSGVHTLNMWMREDGLKVDKLILSPLPTFQPPNDLLESSIRVNAGGRFITDDEGLWFENSNRGNLSSVNGGTTAFTLAAIDTSHSSVPPGTPSEIFESERYSDQSDRDLSWMFTVDPGLYTVRLYFAETWSGAFAEGRRIFDVSIEGEKVLSQFDIFAEVGANKALVKEFTTTSDAVLNIDLQRIRQNPSIKAIEIISMGVDSVDFSVTANGQDVSSPPGLEITTGQSISWNITALNTGVTELTDIQIRLDEIIIQSDPDNISLFNDSPDDILCTIASIPAREEGSCTIVTSAKAGDRSVSFVLSALGLTDELELAKKGYYTGLPPEPTGDDSALVSIIANAASGTVDSTFTFEASETFFDQSGNEVPTPSSAIFEWNISDGRTLTGRTVSFGFSNDGLHTVEVTVSTPNGVSASTDIAITLFAAGTTGPSQLSLPDRFSDVNDDGLVSALDYLILAQHLGDQITISDGDLLLRADLDLDGDISGRDLELLGKAVLGEADLPSVVFSESPLKPFGKATLVSPSLLDPNATFELSIDGLSIDLLSRNVLGYMEFVIPGSVTGGRTTEIVITTNGIEVDRVPLSLEQAPTVSSDPLTLLREYRDLLQELLPFVVDNYREIYGDGSLANIYEETQTARLAAFSDIITTIENSPNNSDIDIIAEFMVANGLQDGIDTLKKLKEQTSVSADGNIRSIKATISPSADICVVVDAVCGLRKFNEDYGDAAGYLSDVCIVGSLIAAVFTGGVAGLVAPACLIIDSASLVNTVANGLAKDINFALIFNVSESEPGQVFNLLPQVELKDGTGICRAGVGGISEKSKDFVADKIADAIEALIKKKLKLDKIKRLLDRLGRSGGSIQDFEDFIQDAIGSRLPGDGIAEDVISALEPICDSFDLVGGKLVGTTTNPLDILDVDLSKGTLSPIGDGSADFSCTASGEVVATATKGMCSSPPASIPKTLSCGGSEVTVTFGDNGSLLDDIFAVDIGGQSFASNSPVRSTSGTVTLPSGTEQTVTMRGLAAPDGIGTYFISFSGASVISGSTSGTDLAQGVTKTFVISVD